MKKGLPLFQPLFPNYTRPLPPGDGGPEDRAVDKLGLLGRGTSGRQWAEGKGSGGGVNRPVVIGKDSGKFFERKR